jgi:peptidase M28-like protein
MGRFFALILLSVCAVTAADIPRIWREALEGISPDSMRGHLSFLAADALAGRDTPSAGLSVAAEYIAAQFRRAGLEPAGGEGYFHTAHWKLRRSDGVYLKLETPNRILHVAGAQIAAELSGPLSIRDAAVRVVELGQAGSLTNEEIRGQALAVLMPALELDDQRAMRSAYRSYRALSRTAAEAKPAVLLVIDPSGLFANRMRRPQLIDPAKPPQPGVPRIAVTDADVAGMMKESGSDVRVSAESGPPVDEDVELHNVVGILRGSDPRLKETAVMLSAHYDHVGVKQSGDGDLIYNGANDNGSGTVSVIEMASGLAGLKQRPKRSLLFVTFFGEEKGMLGSSYYAANPPFPLADTVANLNLEQVGRTDSLQGRQLKRASITGFDFSEVGELFRQAGEMTGIEVYKDKKNSDAYFRASDNFRLAEKGVPAHSITVAFQYPDYHGLGDHWEKVDYDNMAAVSRMIALGMLIIADRDEPPQWDATNSKTEEFRKARGQ